MTELWGLLADEVRLRVFAAVALGAGPLADVADRADVDLPAAVKALRRLENGGVLVRDGDTWALRRDVIAAEARRTAAPSTQYVEDGLPREQATVLRAFLRDGRLTRLPATRSKRLVVLDHVAKVFEIGTRYPESEVDTMMRAFHDDYAALRRHLVDEGFLSRASGVYWRSGGTVSI